MQRKPRGEPPGWTLPKVLFMEAWKATVGNCFDSTWTQRACAPASKQRGKAWPRRSGDEEGNSHATRQPQNSGMRERSPGGKRTPVPPVSDTTAVVRNKPAHGQTREHRQLLYWDYAHTDYRATRPSKGGVAGTEFGAVEQRRREARGGREGGDRREGGRERATAQRRGSTRKHDSVRMPVGAKSRSGGGGTRGEAQTPT